MGFIVVIVLIFYLPKLLHDAAFTMQRNKEYRENQDKVYRVMAANDRKRAEKYDYYFNPVGHGKYGGIEISKYSDGSWRHDPETAKPIEKGKIYPPGKGGTPKK